MNFNSFTGMTSLVRWTSVIWLGSRRREWSVTCLLGWMVEPRSPRWTLDHHCRPLRTKSRGSVLHMNRGMHIPPQQAQALVSVMEFTTQFYYRVPPRAKAIAFHVIWRRYMHKPVINCVIKPYRVIKFCFRNKYP